MQVGEGVKGQKVTYPAYPHPAHRRTSVRVGLVRSNTDSSRLVLAGRLPF